MKFLFHMLVTIYYASSITYICCHTLTPRLTPSKTRLGCFLLIFFSVAPYTFWDSSTLAGLFIIFSMAVSCIFFYSDSFFNKVVCLIIIYITQILIEAGSYLFTDLIYYIVTGKTHSASFLYKAPEWASFLMLVFISAFGIVFIPFLTRICKKWLQHKLTKAVATVALPLIFPVYFSILFDAPIVDSHPCLLLAIYIVLYLFSYLPAHWGITTLYKHSKEYYLAQKQTLLAQQQLAYSIEVEKQFNEIKKWDHDISNHLLTLSILFEEGLFAEAEDYIAPLLASTPEKTTQKENAYVKNCNL